MYGLIYIGEFGDENCVCPVCHSDLGLISESGGVRCLDCRTEDGKRFRLQEGDQHSCSACGWHVLSMVGLTSGPAWQCTRCHTRFAGGLSTGPTGKPRIAQTCPTC